MMLIFLILSVFGTHHLALAAYATSYDQAFSFTCDVGKYLQTIESIHSNYHEDRVFNFGCESLKDTHAEETMKDCVWGPYANDMDGILEFQCPGDKIISGLSSYHDNHYEDRRYKFYCCNPGNLVPYDCKFTSFINSYDNLLTYRVPDRSVIRGVNSVHDNSHEDRIFKFDICKLGALADEPTVG
ncbi:hemagglutinin/amebocyte aggregation factor [Aplysia californica]|uniref:Hemagglutinin/amebocyte aggregation factor n=1 Tax=Aplysia californica TaxID=6500 RepID=A0ABM0JRF5_APLCA|nr:hemagglutinin/amebocyte aggregation factor [Aplysia californica]